MKLSIHLSTAVAGAAATYALTGDAVAAALFFVSAGLIDVDHVLDYLIIHRRFDIKAMLRGHFYKDRIYVLLHSAEIPIVALLVWPGVYSTVFAAGYFLHLAMDMAEYSFRNPLLTYFLSYRLAIGFEKKKICADVN
ncbi:MAG: hypothetical protein WC408_05130 [Candidatus Micrarchaeia archaeon]|jgi:hypothetical protein